MQQEALVRISMDLEEPELMRAVASRALKESHALYGSSGLKSKHGQENVSNPTDSDADTADESVS